MSKPKKHTHKGLIAYYTKKGRLWHVEAEEQTHSFKSIEAMTEAFAQLLEVEAIKKSVERRKASRPSVVTKTIEDHYDSKMVECYYCNGSGEVFENMQCPNCDSSGQFTVTTRGL